MTVNGVAIATVISNGVSVILLYRRLRNTTQSIHLDPKQLRIDGPMLRRILRIGLPAGLQSAIFCISNIMIQAAINSLGTVVMAASSSAYNIEVVTYYILNSFSQACTTFVGQNFGAGEIRRCRKTLLLCLIEGVIALLTIFGVCVIRIAWIQLVFPHSRTFRTIMTAYPISLFVTMLLIFCALMYFRPSKRFAHTSPAA